MAYLNPNTIVLNSFNSPTFVTSHFLVENVGVINNLQISIDRSSNSVTKSNIYNNCSGKHAGLLGFIKHMGYNHKDYINHNNQIHAHINNYIQKKTSLESINFAIDGCSLPTPYFTLSTLASLYIQLLTAKKK